MKAEITIDQVYYNETLFDFFFRKQSQRTLEELLERAKGENIETLDMIDEYADTMEITLDDIEEMFYHEGVEELAEEMGIEIEEDEEEDEETL